MPRDRCVRCLPIIRRRCHVNCLRVALCHVIICISSACFSKLASDLFPRCPFCNLTLLCPPASPFVSCCERVLNFLGMARGLPSGLGIAPVDRLSSFVSFGGRLIFQRLTGYPQKGLFCLQPNTPSKVAQNPS